MNVLSQQGQTIYIDVDKKRAEQAVRYAFWEYDYYTFSGCCGSRFCSPSSENSVKFFNTYNQGIQLMVNPGDVKITPPGKADTWYHSRQGWPEYSGRSRNEFELVDVKIEDVHLLFKLCTRVGEKND